MNERQKEIRKFDVRVGGVKLKCAATDDYKDGATIVFLHESFGCISHWRDFPYDLAESVGMNALVYDRQGYGQSDPFSVTERGNDYLEREADVLDQLLVTLGMENVVLFGHSDGGSIALLAAAKYPGRIKAVITEGAHVFVEQITLDGIRMAEKAYAESDLRAKLARYHQDKTDMVFRLWTDTWLSEQYREWNIEDSLKKIICPVLVIQGVRDEYGSIAQVESIEKNTSGPAYRCMPEAGHTPHRETPEIVMEAVKEFLTDIR